MSNTEALLVPQIPVSGRSCGTCAMCCKVYPIEAVNKPAFKLCTKFKPGKGCTIWPERPDTCSRFYCRWMLDERLGPQWKPDVCKFVMSYQTPTQLFITVDPVHKGAWKQEPYYSVLKKQAEKHLEVDGRIVVCDGGDIYCILPHEDVIVARYGGVLNFRVERKSVGAVTIYSIMQNAAAAA
jgi:hypothetical protein